MTPLPVVVRLLHLDFAVLVVDRDVFEVDGKVTDCDTVRCIIRIREQLPARFEAECLWHEINHALTDLAMPQEDKERMREEVVVSQLSRLQLATFRQNPALVAYLMERIA
jgi:hypothetical protein